MFSAKLRCNRAWLHEELLGLPFTLDLLYMCVTVCSCACSSAQYYSVSCVTLKNCVPDYSVMLFTFREVFAAFKIICMFVRDFLNET